jgi:NAD(P)-dependent dehydrogenase (short-subunit alcohol dehydrogenase family)
MPTLDDKVALVTGASRGIGAAIAVQLAAQGAAVFLAANDTEEWFQRTEAKCKAANPGARTSRGIFDFFRVGDAEKMVAAAVKSFGRVDILVNNAGIRIRKPLGEFSNEDFDQVVAVNLKAPFFATQAVIPVMKANGGGRIVNIASQMAEIAEQNLALYGLTKAALVHLTKSMAFELAPHNIIVNAVSPGPTMTEYNEERTAQHPEYKALKMSYIRAGRYGRPEEIAEVVAFLATTGATYMQGHNLIVDGGYVIH